jgi:hypothetical protein
MPTKLLSHGQPYSLCLEAQLKGYRKTDGNILPELGE